MVQQRNIPPASPTTPPAARRHDNNAAWDADEDARPDGDPAAAKDAGILESLGKAVSAPIVDADADAAKDDRSREAPPRRP